MELVRNIVEWPRLENKKMLGAIELHSQPRKGKGKEPLLSIDKVEPEDIGPM